MNRHMLVTGVLMASLFGGLSACSGSDDKPEAKPTATKATTTAAPTPAPQPKGADGVTYEIQNWDKYADNPAVVAWKQIFEASNASVNRRKIVGLARTSLPKKNLRLLSGNLKTVIKEDWHVKSVAKVRVESTATTGNRARLVICAWAPSTGLYDSKQRFVGKAENYWKKFLTDMRSDGDRWVIKKIAIKGKCPGGEPT